MPSFRQGEQAPGTSPFEAIRQKLSGIRDRLQTPGAQRLGAGLRGAGAALQGRPMDAMEEFRRWRALQQAPVQAGPPTGQIQGGPVAGPNAGPMASPNYNRMFGGNPMGSGGGGVGGYTTNQFGMGAGMGDRGERGGFQVPGPRNDRSQFKPFDPSIGRAGGLMGGGYDF